MEELFDFSEFVNRKADKDILVSVIVRKSKRKFRYESIRQTKTDFPGTDMFCRNRNLQRSGVLVLFGRSKTDESGIA